MKMSARTFSRFFQTFWDPRAGGPGRLFPDFLGISGPEVVGGFARIEDRRIQISERRESDTGMGDRYGNDLGVAAGRVASSLGTNTGVLQEGLRENENIREIWSHMLGL